MRRSCSRIIGEWVAGLALVGAGAIVGAGSVRAELVYFARGGQVQLPASAEGTTVRLQTPDGPREFPRSDFRKVVPGHWPEGEWDARRRAALAGRVEARSAAAWWALENGLTPQAVAMVRAAHDADPAHPPTARMIAALGRLVEPCDDPDLEPLRRALGVATEVARGPHVVLLHQHTTAEASERIDVLERVVSTYYLMFAAQGVELPVPGRRMASAWLADQADYLAFLRATGSSAFLSTRGYYHPTLDVVVAYDARCAPDQKAAREALAARRRALQHLSEAIDHLPRRGRLRLNLPGEPARLCSRAEARDLLETWRRDLDRRQLLLETDRRAIDGGTAAHEMVHQLVRNSGLIRRHDDFPVWLHEGLATQFEVVRGGVWAGVGRVHDLRLPDWRAIAPPPPLIPLLRDLGFEHGYRRDLYAQAWALVYFLRKERPRQFQTFLDLLRNPAPEAGSDADRTSAAFRTAFGDDLPALEASWHRYMARLKTPLEGG